MATSATITVVSATSATPLTVELHLALRLPPAVLGDAFVGAKVLFLQVSHCEFHVCAVRLIARLGK